MHALFVFILMICWQAPVAPSSTPKINKPKSKYEAKNSTIATPSQTPLAFPATPMGQPTPSPQKDDDKCKTKGEPYAVNIVHQPFDVLILFYVLITGVAAFAALRTLSKIKEQARLMNCQLAEMQNAGMQTAQLIAATQQSANAAKRSADALIDIERPWLLIRDRLDLTERFDQGSGYHMTFVFKFKFKNFGKTPARIESVRGRFMTVQSLADLPPEPEYRDAPRYTEFTVFAPGEESGWVSIPYDDGQMDEATSIRVRIKAIMLLGMGEVIYSAFNRQHVTRFCYLYRSDHNAFIDLIGPNESYNRHT